MLFQGGIDRSGNLDVQRKIQSAIYLLQVHMEEIYSLQNPKKLLLCDRGTLDGLAYWPDGEMDFFGHIQSNLEKELQRYDAVIFFETGAKSGCDISSNNPIRNESRQKSIDLDEKLQEIWSQHPNYHFIASSESFIKKTMFGIMTIENVIAKQSNAHGTL